MKTYLLLCLSLVMMVFVVTGCYEVVYQVEVKGPCIKFEDAQYDQDPDPDIEDMVDACLGDDEVEQTDTFAAVVDGEVDVILVSLKAGGGKNGGKVTDIPVQTDGTPATVGNFTVIAGLYDESEGEYTYVMTVTSDDDNSTPALSHIIFCFGDAEILAPEEGEPAVTIRETDLSEPGEPEED